MGTNGFERDTDMVNDTRSENTFPHKPLLLSEISTLMNDKWKDEKEDEDVWEIIQMRPLLTYWDSVCFKWDNYDDDDENECKKLWKVGQLFADDDENEKLR